MTRSRQYRQADRSSASARIRARRDFRRRAAPRAEHFPRYDLRVHSAVEADVFTTITHSPSRLRESEPLNMDVYAEDLRFGPLNCDLPPSLSLSLSLSLSAVGTISGSSGSSSAVRQPAGSCRLKNFMLHA